MPDFDSNHITKLLRQLNNHCARSLDEAARLAISRAQAEIGIEHWLLKLIGQGEGDIPRLLKAFRIDEERLWSALLGNIERYETDPRAETPRFAQDLVHLIDEARRFCLVDLESSQIRSGALLFAMLSLRGYRLPGALQMLDSIPLAMLRREYLQLTAGSIEQAPSPEVHDAEAPAAKAGHLPLSPARVVEALSKYTVDLTRKARQGEIDPVFGREGEIRQLIDILSRRRKNNPILVGEPGVGKTAIVEGLALQIAQGAVPPALKDVELRTLDLGLLQAGASMKGEFESRLRAIIDEVKLSSVPVMLFIDEAHTLIGAGNAPGAGDAANLLKPALARGELRTIAATTWGEYKQYFERDAALERRFQMVKVDEPGEAAAVGMLRGLKSRYESFHGVNITDEAVIAAVKLATRYIPARQLPDKGVDLLDTASARVRMSAAMQPAVLSRVSESVAGLRREREALLRDLDLAQVDKPAIARQRLGEIETELIRAHGQQLQLQTQLEREQHLAQELQLRGAELREQLEIGAADNAEARLTALREAIRKLRSDLSAVQGDSPLVHLEVDAHAIAEVVADWTGVPVARMLKDDMANLLALEAQLGERVVGQEAGIALIAEGIRNARLGLRKREAPMAVFLLVGPSGVGKTETALALADILYGGERSVTTINMSEYQEAHTVSQLKGSPPGYVGYGQGGVLTEAVRQRPYGVVLLDEVEKAHRDVMNLFYQVFDRGFMRDGEGREIDFKNTVILMTSNLGSEALMELWRSRADLNAAMAAEAIRPELLAHFQPALLARMQVVPYLPLEADKLASIVGLKLGRLADRLKEAWNIQVHSTGELGYVLADECSTPDSGARAIDRLIEQSLLPAISRELLTRMSHDALPVAIFISADAQEGINIDYVDDSSEVGEIKLALDMQSTAQLSARLLAKEAQRKASSDDAGTTPGAPIFPELDKGMKLQ